MDLRQVGGFADAVVSAFSGMGAVQLFEEMHLVFGIPADAFTAVASFIQQRPKRGKPLIGIRIIALNHIQVWHGDARNGLTFTFPPGFDAIRLGELCRGVMVHWRGDQIGFNPQVARA